MGFHIKGILASLIVLLPSILFMLLPPRGVPGKQRAAPIILTVLERLGQVGCFAAPLLFGRKIAEQRPDFITFLMGVCLIFYYICWIRYFTRGREFPLLFRPLGFIPIPMAVFPVIYFILLGIWLKSYIFIIPAVFLAVGHLANSWSIYKQL